MEVDRLLQKLLYWGVWLIIPLLWEIALGIFSTVIVTLKNLKKKSENLEYYPIVSILIPVYNSRATLEMCLKSLADQNYPAENLEIFLIDNGSKDDSYEVFTKFQTENPRLKLWWHCSEQGKSKALNHGVFSSSGKYIINIDSDGWLDRDAVKNVVTRFESNKDIAGMTGVVLIDPKPVAETNNKLLRIMRICELFEYIESFLVGRNFQSTFDSMYTLSGAFSCFRREALMKTQMYNPETMGEDAHMTFQIKNFVGGRLTLCENAFLYTDPIESLDKLYTQRQRWQRAELEVASLFSGQHLGNVFDFFRKPAIRKIVSDHTLTFPRLIWFFAMIYLYFINYPLNLLAGANFLMYAAYVCSSFLYLLTGIIYLKEKKAVRTYVVKNWHICFVLPFYRFIVYWVRLAGSINSLTTESRWRTSTLSEEIATVKGKFRENINTRLGFMEKVKKFINN